MQHTRPSAPKNLRLTPVYLPPATFLPADDLDSILTAQGFPTEFDVETLAAGIAQGCSVGAIREYVENFPRQQVEEGVKGLVKGCHPVLFYALERNCVGCVRLLLEQRCEANVADNWSVPALAFAIMKSKWSVVNPTEVAKTLLGFGAEPGVVPKDMWEQFLEPPAITPANDSDERPEEQTTIWCEAHHRRILAETLNLSVRYFLHKAS